MRNLVARHASLLVGTITGAVSPYGCRSVHAQPSAPTEWWTSLIQSCRSCRRSTAREPKLIVDAAHFYFGRMERKATGHHTFVLKNMGDYPLVLRKGKTTCKCTLSDMADCELLPGASKNVTLEWNAKTHDTIFRQEATIFTNDPRRRTVTLTIEGLIVDSLVVNPPEIVFTNLTPDEESTAKTRAFTSLSDELQIVGHSFENAETAKFFEVQSTPLPRIRSLRK